MELNESFYIDDEVCDVSFGDPRLTQRLKRISQRLSEKPNLSLPAALHTRKEMEAAYRFCDNDKVSPGQILSTHIARTHDRIAQQSVTLLVQDSTEFNLTRPKQQVKGAGPLSANSRQGAYLHPLLAFTPERIPLGVVWQTHWARESIETTQTQKEKTKALAETPIEDKESYRWVEGHHAALDTAQLSPNTQCVLIGDSESDIYEVFAESRETFHGRPLELLVRGCQNRATDETGNLVFDRAREADCLGTMTVAVSGRTAKTNCETRKRSKSREARVAEVEIRATSITLKPPPRHDRKLPPVTLNVILVEEANPPEGEDAIQWLLLTTLPTQTLSEVQTVINYYTCRWGIEVYFKVLKSGCRVEKRQFEELDRLMNIAAIYLVIAWRVMLLCHLGRECPDINCEVIFEPAEWKSVYQIVKHKEPPVIPPSLNEVIRIIASLGGYVLRKSTEPGPQTLWIGIQRMHDFAKAYEIFRGDKFF
jgi:hypothetical protein